MSRNVWHKIREGDRLTHARALPPRFDVEARAEFPPARADRLARQIRQDMWRALQRTPGFSPVVEVTKAENGLTVRAGGRLTRPAPKTLAARIAALLEAPHHRRRWLRYAANSPRERSLAKSTTLNDAKGLAPLTRVLHGAK